MPILCTYNIHIYKFCSIFKSDINYQVIITTEAKKKIATSTEQSKYKISNCIGNCNGNRIGNGNGNDNGIANCYKMIIILLIFNNFMWFGESCTSKTFENFKTTCIINTKLI